MNRGGQGNIHGKFEIRISQEKWSKPRRNGATQGNEERGECPQDTSGKRQSGTIAGARGEGKEFGIQP